MLTLIIIGGMALVAIIDHMQTRGAQCAAIEAIVEQWRRDGYWVRVDRAWRGRPFVVSRHDYDHSAIDYRGEGQQPWSLCLCKGYKSEKGLAQDVDS